MTKKVLLILLIFAFISPLMTQSISQIAFIIKKALPDVENIAVIYPKHLKDSIVSQAKTAQLVTKKNITVYGVSRKSELSNELYNIKRLKNAAVIIITDDNILAPKAIQFILEKLGTKNMPLISNRSKDTLQGALLSIFVKDNQIEKHINKIVAAALNLNIPEEFYTECIIDVE
jgi:ABC-type uncharacterized transport system substrate-binding protein